MRRFVLDASTALAWSLEDEPDPEAHSVFNALQRYRALVPVIWPMEVANALLSAERRRRLTDTEARWILRQLAALPIDIDDTPPARLLEEIWALGRTHRLTTYDAAYLDLAMRRALPLASHDRALRAAAARCGIELFAPADG